MYLQVLRSIDSDSADGFPSHQEEAHKMGLDSGKGKIIDVSIQKVLSQCSLGFIAQHSSRFWKQVYCWSARPLCRPGRSMQCLGCAPSAWLLRCLMCHDD